MPTSYRKKLIEVALPLEAINKESAREKSIRHGHPSTLHLWWARRPLAACRAVLFASLVDDPDSDPAYAQYDAETREHMAGEKRQQLFALIEELVKWENSNNELIINAARAEIARCVASRKIELGELKKDHKLPGGETVYDLVVKGHGDLAKLRAGHARLPRAESVNAFLAEHAPPVLDPFAGGGSIPLEAQRLGLRAYASDLNPVPVLINKALIEIPPKFANKPPVNPDSRGEAGPAGKKGKGKGKSVLGVSEWRGAQGLADDVRYYGQWMRDEAEKRIGHLYPKVAVTADMAKGRPDLKPYVGEELTVIAWLWARTVASPNPAVGGAHVPLVKSFTLVDKGKKRAWVQPVIDRDSNTYQFKVQTGDGDIPSGTVGLGKRRCLLSDDPMELEYVRREGRAGRIGFRMMAIVAEGHRERVYLPPQDSHEIVSAVDRDGSPADMPLAENARYMTPTIYGMTKFSDLFTPRQLLAMRTFCDLCTEARAKVFDESRDRDYANAVSLYLAFGVSKLANRSCAVGPWMPSVQCPGHVFTRHAIPMNWDFAESNVVSGTSGTFASMIDNTIAGLLSTDYTHGVAARVQQGDVASILRTARDVIISTDPPYYDNVPYADLADFFYIWLRYMLGEPYPEIMKTVLVPKSEELVADTVRQSGKQGAKFFFEAGMKSALAEAKRSVSTEVPTTIFYAFKQTDEEARGDTDESTAPGPEISSTGWETMLEGLVESGWQVLGTWPVRTERQARTRGIESNALASSIVLSCRPQIASAPLATRREFINSLKRELPEALKNLQHGNIAPVDLAQASIGPGMAVFTRYAKVMEADGTPMKVRQALALINQTLDEVLAEQEGEFDADTRWALSWFEQFGMDEGAFGIAETLSKAKNTAVNALVDAGLIHARSGKVRLLKRDEMPADWNPATDHKVRHWEVAQHLIRALETGGETAAADLLRRVGGMGEVARDLAYRLYNICERKKWASEALAYNGLVIAWPEISKLAAQAATVQGEQATMF